mgnify:CR=1 FL=1
MLPTTLERPMVDPLLFLALDVPNGKSAMDLLTRIGKESLTHVKVGLQLFIAEGPEFVRSLVLQGYRVALDIKLDDIPETVMLACQQVAALGVHYVMAHVGGGRAMLEAAVRGVGDSETKVLAVRVLTSLTESDLAEIGTVTGSVEILVVQRALLAKQAGCHGVIASPSPSSPAWPNGVCPRSCASASVSAKSSFKPSERQIERAICDTSRLWVSRVR